MIDASLPAVLRLLRVQALIAARFGPPLGAVHGLALTEVLLLLQLSRAPLGRLRRVDLAARLHTSQSTITRMCLPLEKGGFVRREADARDARVGYVVLTDAGRQRTDEALATLERLAREVFRDRWTGEEVQTLAQLLGRISSALPGDLDFPEEGHA
ncbi:MAG TPA: MarR family transcriptional regulator [Caulobacteraceae bacterium]